ncbi:iron-sulfur cluster carrier protein ApbC [bacterium]|jgi:ATP-binding protein involved in chromosome partitioning|nr:iron-sulfur cluster carrier protein ApbC [bacterium]
MKKPDFEAVLNALRTVNDPDLKRDLVSLNMVRDLKVFEDGKVSFRIVLTTPACPLKEQIREEAERAVRSVAGVVTASIVMDAEVRRPGQVGGGASAASGIPGVTHILAVSSGKGGVGKSTVSVNLATSLALDGARVGLLDADIYGPNIPTMMGVTDNPKLFVHPEKGEMFVPPESHGVKVMSMGFLVQGDQPVIWRGPMLHNILNQFCNKVDWGQLDYLVLDLPPGTGDVQLSLAQMLPMTGAVIVTTPQEISLQDVRKALNMWDKVKVPVLGVVENMSWFTGDDGKKYRIFGEGGGESLARKFHTTLLTQLPLVPQVREGGDTGRPIVVKDPSSESAALFRKLSGRVAQEVSIRSSKSESGASLEIGAFGSS